MFVRKVVIPVAGWGTRSLPATKNVPKEMLPVYRKPVIQYVVEEAIAAKLADVFFVNNQNKTIIEDHFDYNLALENVLSRSGKDDLLAQVREVAEMANISIIRQKQQLGLGHAVLCARQAVGDEPFAVMVGDDLLFSMEPAIGQLMEAARSEHMPIVGVMEVPDHKVSNYGIIQGEEFGPGQYRVRSVVEKPALADAPSNLAIVGRYILTPDVFDLLAETKPGYGGEIQLTDALQTLASRNRLLAVKVRGMRFDAGDWVDYLTANIYFALQDDELRDHLTKRLHDLLGC